MTSKEEEIDSIVKDIIKSHEEDVPFLDALYQYADSPSAKAAARHENKSKYIGGFDYYVFFTNIPENLELRYPKTDGEEVKERVREEVRRFSDIIDMGSGKDIGTVREMIKDRLNPFFEEETSIGDLERKESIRQLAKFVKEKEEEGEIKPKRFRLGSDRVKSSKLDWDYLRKEGLVNKLYKCSRRKAIDHDVYVVPEYVWESIKNIGDSEEEDEDEERFPCQCSKPNCNIELSPFDKVVLLKNEERIVYPGHASGEGKNQRWTKMSTLQMVKYF